MINHLASHKRESLGLKKILVTGATSQIGDFLLPRLVDAGYEVVAISRTERHDIDNVTWVAADLDDGIDHTKLEGVGALIHTAPLWVLPALIDQLASVDVNRIIAFGSTSVFTKGGSSTLAERNVVEELQKGESQLKSLCEAKNIKWTLFRPTLIYGAGRDQNVSSIAKLIDRWNFFPLVGRGEGLRQPVHADDLAKASLLALENEKTFGKSYNLSGGETLTYRQMVEAIFKSLNKKPRFISLPVPLLRLLIKMTSLLPQLNHLTPDMVDRMSVDLVFDHSDATTDFGYTPSGFNLVK